MMHFGHLVVSLWHIWTPSKMTWSTELSLMGSHEAWYDLMWYLYNDSFACGICSTVCLLRRNVFVLLGSLPQVNECDWVSKRHHHPGLFGRQPCGHFAPTECKHPSAQRSTPAQVKQTRKGFSCLVGLQGHDNRLINANVSQGQKAKTQFHRESINGQRWLRTKGAVALPHNKVLGVRWC